MTTNEPVVNWETHAKLCDLVDEHRCLVDQMSDAEKSDDFFYTNGSRASFLRQINQVADKIRDLCPTIDMHRTGWANSTWFDAFHSGTKISHVATGERVQ